MSRFTPLKGEFGVDQTKKRADFRKVLTKLHGPEPVILEIPKEKLTGNRNDCLDSLSLFLAMHGMRFESRWLTSPPERGGVIMYFSEDSRLSYAYDFVDPRLYVSGDKREVQSLAKLVGEWRKMGCPQVSSYPIELSRSVDTAVMEGGVLRRKSVVLRISRTGR